MYEVIVIDDSPLMQKILSDIINRLDDYHVIDVASDAYEARELIKKHEPDLVTIDINMPKMDGVTFLKNLMRLHPMPAVVVSTDVSQHHQVFDDGAVGFIKKKDIGETDDIFFQRVEDILLRLSFLVKRYQDKKPPKVRKIQAEMDTVKNNPDVLLESSPAKRGGKAMIAIGASTGGIETLMQIFKSLEPPLPPIFITLHIPYGFSSSFAQRLDRLSTLKVYEAKDGQVVKNSDVYLAPGNKHMTLEKVGSQYQIKLIDGPRISRHKPSVDMLFRSVNNAIGSSAMGVMLTGMGDDGVIGFKEMHDSGAYTIAQDEASSVVYGMPKKAFEAGAVRKVVPLNQVAVEIVKFASSLDL